MAKQIRRYGVKRQTAVSDDADAHAERISFIGYSIVEAAVPHAKIDELRDQIDYHLDRQIAAVGGEGMARKIGEFGTLRASVTLDSVFLQVAQHAVVLSIVSRLLGDYFILMLQNAIVAYSNLQHHQSAFHRDLPYQHFVTSRPLAVNAILCVDDFTSERGCTRIIPGSHKSENFPSDPLVERLEVPLEAPAGSFILFDAMSYHRGGENVSGGCRRAINSCYSLPFLKQQIDLPAVFGSWHGFDVNTARLLGFESRSAESVEEWYQLRKAHAGL